jgi:hypothetical protein
MKLKTLIQSFTGIVELGPLEISEAVLINDNLETTALEYLVLGSDGVRIIDHIH